MTEISSAEKRSWLRHPGLRIGIVSTLIFLLIGFVSIDPMLLSPTICTWSRFASRGGVGAERLKRTVVSSTTSTLLTVATCGANWLAIFGSWTRLIVNATSFAVNGLPSCHLTPDLSLKVTVLPFFEIVHDSASFGCTASVEGSTHVSVSNTADRIEWRNTSSVER